MSQTPRRRLLGTFTLFFTLATSGMVCATARAGAIVYNTSGLIGSSGVTGANTISFVPVSANSFTAPSTLSLGTFVVTPLSDGQTTTYNHTPFSVNFRVTSVNGISLVDGSASLTVTGFLNGILSGSNRSTVVAVFDPIANPNIKIGPLDFVNLSLPSPQRTLVPSTSSGGQSTAEAFVRVFQETPEPTAIAMFVVAGAALGLVRLRRRAA